MEVFSKTRFQQAYQMAMAEQAPKMHRELMKAGTLKEHLLETANEAQAMYEHQVEFLMEKHQMDRGQAGAIATDQVFAEYIRF